MCPVLWDAVLSVISILLCSSPINTMNRSFDHNRRYWEESDFRDWVDCDNEFNNTRPRLYSVLVIGIVMKQGIMMQTIDRCQLIVSRDTTRHESGHRSWRRVFCFDLIHTKWLGNIKYIGHPMMKVISDHSSCKVPIILSMSARKSKKNQKDERNYSSIARGMNAKGAQCHCCSLLGFISQIWVGDMADKSPKWSSTRVVTCSKPTRNQSPFGDQYLLDFATMQGVNSFGS